jgi:transcriptional regulator with XRE-family HTH domain
MTSLGPQPGPTAVDIGQRLRSRRAELGLSARELARRLSLSPSLISQIENGKSNPSVGTLYLIVTELDLSLDELFSSTGADASPRKTNGAGDAVGAAPQSPVVTEHDREELQLASGVRWQRLTHTPDPNVDFLHVIYEPGGASCAENALMRHAGFEYGYVLEGTLRVAVGFSSYQLGPGDSISFPSTEPHRLAADGNEPVHAIWVVIGRLGDGRVGVRAAGDDYRTSAASAPSPAATRSAPRTY